MAEATPASVTMVPTIEVQGPAGRAIIRRVDWPEWSAKGYKPVPGETPPGDVEISILRQNNGLMPMPPTSESDPARESIHDGDSKANGKINGDNKADGDDEN